MFPGIIEHVSPKGTLAHKLRDNIAQFLIVLEKLGVFPLFVVEDLYSAKNIPHVLTTIERFAAIAGMKGYHITWQAYSRTMEKRAQARSIPIDTSAIPQPPPEPEPEQVVVEAGAEEEQKLDASHMTGHLAPAEPVPEPPKLPEPEREDSSMSKMRLVQSEAETVIVEPPAPAPVITVCF